MVSATLTRGPTAHTDSTLAKHAPGSRTVMIEKAYIGEDVPLVVKYHDSSGSDVDPDSAPTITVTSPDDTAVVDSVAMTAVSGATGEYEHVWDTSTESAGTYQVEVTAELTSETKIDKDEIDLVA